MVTHANGALESPPEPIAPEPAAEPVFAGRSTQWDSGPTSIDSLTPTIDRQRSGELPQDAPGDAAPGSAPTGWVESQDRLLARRMGLEDADVDAFGSRDEFTRAMDVLDRQQRRMAAAQPRVQPAPAPAAAEEGETKAPETPWIKDGKLNLDYYKQTGEDGEPIYDPATLAIIESQARTEAFITDMIAQQQQQAAQSFANEFHDALDALDPDYFGRSLVNGKHANLHDAQADRRSQIADAIMRVAPLAMQEAEVLGIAPPTVRDLIERVHRSSGRAVSQQPAAPSAAPAQPVRRAAPPVASPTLDDEDDGNALRGANGQPLHGAALRSRQQALLDQSNRRRPAGTTRDLPPVRGEEPDGKQLTRQQRALMSPAVTAAYQRMRAEAGLDNY